MKKIAALVIVPKMNQYSLLALLATFVAVSSSPLTADECTISDVNEVYEKAKICDPLIIDSMTVPAGVTLEIKVKTGGHLQFKGTIKFEYAEWEGPLMTIKGEAATVDAEGAVFDGQGQLYWDGKGAKGIKKPKFFRLRTTGGSKLSNMYLLNCPVHCVSIQVTDTIVDNFLIDVSAGDEGALGHNTDGFDVGHVDNLVIQNTVVKNQDDCIVINQGYNSVFRNITCSGGHGLSLSVGQSTEDGEKNTVKNITFIDSSVINSRNGIHVKTHTNAGTGAIDDVIYKNIKLEDIHYYGVNVQQDYKGGKSTGIPGNNIPINNLVLDNVSGTMADDDTSMPVYILCGDTGCDHWSWSQVAITDGELSSKCNYLPTGYSC